MSKVKEWAALLRGLVSRGAHSAANPGRPRHTGGEIYARAWPEVAALTEKYFFKQEISLNPQKELAAAPTGKIELRVPYDGYEYFTRQALDDVAMTAGRYRSDDNATALIGHLLFANYGGTDLDAALGLRQRYGSLPIRVPLSGLSADGGLDSLRSDRQTCVISHDYAPDPGQLRVNPIDVEADLLDPDSLDSYLVDIATTKVIALPMITQQVSFRSHLILRIAVRVTLPKVDGWQEFEPKVANVSLNWPTITSLRAVELRAGRSRSTDDTDRSLADGDDTPFVRYNPLTRCIEWSEIDMERLDTSEDSDTVTFVSRVMSLFIKQPGELYSEQRLDGRVEVRIDDCLLSGVETKLADGVGRVSDGGPSRTTHLFTDLQLRLDDAFARRYLSPFQHLFFDELIPEPARIDDIKSALKDRGFDEPREDRRGDLTYLRTQRAEGPAKMVLWLLVEGRKFQTERVNELPGGHTYKSTLDSGELKVYIRGSLERDSRELTREMNALQQALRERFDRLRARR